MLNKKKEDITFGELTNAVAAIVGHGETFDDAVLLSPDEKAIDIIAAVCSLDEQFYEVCEILFDRIKAKYEN